ncbi:hypothetical protein G6L37_35095 [Agrobacterium rubi]|nr:hypothetical protein [Agrobacterium rubi]NTF23797.1 hypothetical protein [Agrobacterium rubi]
MGVPKSKLRDPVTGQYAYDENWDRMCRCGHALGVHVSGGFDCINAVEGDRTPCDCEKFRPVSTKPTEAEMRLLREVLKSNEHRDGFRSYVVVGAGTKGGNFGKIALQKRAASLVRKGHLSETAHGYEITENGKAQLAATDEWKKTKKEPTDEP